MSARHHQRPGNRVTTRWADVGIPGPRCVEFLESDFDRITEHCAHCGSRGTVWGDRDHARLCTTCGTQYRFVQRPESATGHWATILGCIRKAAGEMPTAQR